MLELLAAGFGWNDDDYYDDLEGACGGLGEIKIDFENIPDGGEQQDDPERICYRVLGYKTDGRREFTMLCGFRKITGSEYSRFCPIAIRRKGKVQKDGRRASIWPF
ncbi:MAG: hypothetical protein ACRD72_26045 [Candidatus Angelobacter sp.]